MNTALLRRLIVTQWLCLLGVVLMPTLVRWLPYWGGKALYAAFVAGAAWAAWMLREAWDQLPR